jgi:hypothetical protein
MALTAQRSGVAECDFDAEALFKEARRRRRRRRAACSAVALGVVLCGTSAAAAFGAFGTTPWSTGSSYERAAAFPTSTRVLTSAGTGLVTAHISDVDDADVSLRANFMLRTRDWVSDSRRVTTQDFFGPFLFSTPEARAAWLTAGLHTTTTTTRSVTDLAPPTSSLGVLNLANLPTDPRQLRVALSQRGPRSLLLPHQFWIWEPTLESRVVALLLSPSVGASTQLDKALCDILIHSSGVRALDTLTSHEGRPGLGFAVAGIFGPDWPGSPVIVLNLQKGEVLELRDWSLSLPVGVPLFSRASIAASPRSFGGGYEALWFDPQTTNRFVSAKSVPTVLVPSSTTAIVRTK